MNHLFSEDKGVGTPVVMLHGFPFHQKLWASFAALLSKHFRVVTPDLPGFGKSPALPAGFSIDDVAERLSGWLVEKNLRNCVLIGHSLGGYVALSAVKNDPSLFAGFGLFHSTSYADSPEKKESREKVIEFIDKNGVQAFTGNFINTLFADRQHPSIPYVKSLALEASAETVKGYTLAMRDRSERTDVLESFAKPILFLAGKKDAGISVDSVHKQASVCAYPEVHILTQAAHMGMFENELKCAEIIQKFVEKATVTSPGESV